MSSHHQLKLLAASTWYLGGIALTLKGVALLTDAITLQPGTSATYWSIGIGLLIGLIKGKLLFTPSCQKNLKRIHQLTTPKIWQFFRPQFFLFLELMIATGTLLSSWAQGYFTSLIAIATLDISLSTALLSSSLAFWNRQASFSRNNR